jgi:hypothetical protein
MILLGFAGLPLADFPLAGGVLDELGQVAGEKQFELGLAALAAGLADQCDPARSRRATTGHKLDSRDRTSRR